METICKILYLDDEFDSAPIQTVLKNAGLSVDVTRVTTQADFESALLNGGYDLILSNYRFQHFDGLTALNWTREIGIDLPFIFVSDSPGEEVVIQALTSGAADYVLRNKLEHLPHAISHALRMSELRAAERLRETELREKDERISTILEVSQDAIYQRSLQTDRYDFISPSFYNISGITAEEMISMPIERVLERMHPDDLDRVEQTLKNAENNPEVYHQLEYRFLHRDGEYRWLQDNIRVILDAEGKPLYRVGMVRDITAQKMAGDALRVSEERYRSIVTAMSEGVVFQGEDGSIEAANPSAERVLGLTHDQLMGRTSTDPRWYAIHEDGSPFPGENHPAMMTLQTKRPQRNVIMGVHKPDGSLSWISINSELVLDAEKKIHGVVTTFTDITQHKAAEDALHISEERYRTLVEQAADGIFIADQTGRYIDVNPSGCRMLGYTKDEILNMTLHDLIADGEREKLEKTILAAASGKPYIVDRMLKMKDGDLLPVEIGGKRMENGNLLGVVRDVRERRRAEEALHFQSNLLASMMDAVIATDLHYKIISWNAAAKKMYGWEEEEVLGKTMAELAQPEYPFDERAEIIKDINAKGAWSGEVIHTRRNGERFPVQALVSAVKDLSGNVIGFVAVNRDITDRKEAEKELRESEDKFKYIFDYSVIGNSITTLKGELSPNRSLCEILGYTCEELRGKNWREFTHPEDIALNEREVLSILAGEKDSARLTKRFIHKNGSIVWTVLSTALRRDEHGQPLYFITSVIDITELKKAEEQTRVQLERLTALKNIDLAITSSFDMRLSLNTVLMQVIDQLDVDAADILIFNPQLNELKCEAASGFRKTSVLGMSIPIGAGHVGRVLLNKRLVYIPDIRKSEEPFIRKNMLDSEGFLAYFAVPLSAKGKVKGVLELFNRQPIEPDADWLNFLETLATQAAIAIDDIQMFEHLENSNLELSLAYDATIEGWSRAMDLRDKETEGHTQRVTEKTLKLASHFGLANEDLKHIRWGSLLHDVGKIGVPDGILHKPIPLNDDDWRVIRNHPIFAYEMLAPIHYLQKALVIPYCHHEKWDGSGYPRGLKEEQIPLEARIFSVVDVWDALTSDRPYRSAWSPEKTLDYIRKEAGHQFDPKVVEAFLEFLKKEGWS